MERTTYPVQIVDKPHIAVVFEAAAMLFILLPVKYIIELVLKVG